MKKLFMPITHNNVVAGFLADGWGVDMSRMETQDGLFSAQTVYNNKRSYSVHAADCSLIGRVHCMSGGRYVALTPDNKQISTYVGNDPEIKCFVDIVQHAKLA